MKILAKTYYKLLDFLATLLMNLSKLVGNQYTFIWPYLHQSSFDHRFDYLRGIDNYSWYERPIFALEKIKPFGDVLDIGCGDGIYSGLFYYKKAKHIDAIDLDKLAIEHAKKHYFRSNVNFKCIKIQDWLKKRKKYDTILMFNVIEHFDYEDGIKILKNVRTSLNENGLFFGSTVLFSDKGEHNFEHKNEFFSQANLRKYLKKVFRRVDIYTSIWPNGQKGCYFSCS